MDSFTDILVEFYEKLSSWEHSVVRDTELSLPQMHAVEVIGTNGEIRMKELASKLGVTTGTLTVMVQRLETLGMVIRRRSSTDARSFTIALTERGSSCFNQHHQSHEELAQELSRDLSPEECEKFIATLQKIIKNI